MWLHYLAGAVLVLVVLPSVSTAQSCATPIEEINGPLDLTVVGSPHCFSPIIVIEPNSSLTLQPGAVLVLGAGDLLSGLDSLTLQPDSVLNLGAGGGLFGLDSFVANEATIVGSFPGVLVGINAPAILENCDLSRISLQPSESIQIIGGQLYSLDLSIIATAAPAVTGVTFGDSIPYQVVSTANFGGISGNFYQEDSQIFVPAFGSTLSGTMRWGVIDGVTKYQLDGDLQLAGSIAVEDGVTLVLGAQGTIDVLTGATMNVDPGATIIFGDPGVWLDVSGKLDVSEAELASFASGDQGIRFYPGSSGLVEGATIVGEDEGGGPYDVDIWLDSTHVVIVDSNFVNAEVIALGDPQDLFELSRNCWGAAITADLIADRVVDQTDDPSAGVGVVNYLPVADGCVFLESVQSHFDDQPRNENRYFSIPVSGVFNDFDRALEFTFRPGPQNLIITDPIVEIVAPDGSLVSQRNSLPDPVVDTTLDEPGVAPNGWVQTSFNAIPSDVSVAPFRKITYRFHFDVSDDGEILDVPPIDVAKFLGPSSTTQRDFFALWDLPASVVPRYGHEDAGGDRWAAVGTIEWLTDFMANHPGIPIRIDDISGEHGKDIGHSTHAFGTDLDVYHFYDVPLPPGFQENGSAVTGTRNYKRLREWARLALTSDGLNPTAVLHLRNYVVATRDAIEVLVLNVVPQWLLVRPVCEVISPRGGYFSQTGSDPLELESGWLETMVRTGTLIGSTGEASTTTISLGLTGWSENCAFASPGCTECVVFKNNHNHHNHISLDFGFEEPTDPGN